MFAYLFAVDDVESVLKQSSFNAHPADFLNEGGLSNPIGAQNLKILGFLLGSKIAKDLVDLFPFPVDARNVTILNLKL